MSLRATRCRTRGPARRRSRPIPGAAASPATQRRAGSNRLRFVFDDSTGGYVQGSTINLTGIGGGAATINLGGVSRPIADNTYTLGDASHRWSQLYAATSTINTSDAREKTAPSEIPDALLDAILSVPIGQDQWLDSVARKGAGKARIHFGPMAQDVRDAILAKGLDPERYALFCKDQKLAAVARTRRVSRPVPPEIVEVETIVVEGGRAIRRQVAAERPVTRRVTVEDESGAPVMRAVPGASTLEPLTIEIPATEEVEETYEALEPVPGEFVYGLRLEQFYALLGLAIRRRAGL
jgi:hypothetical protein